MNTFLFTIAVNNYTVEYQVFPFGKKFKAVLMQSKLVNCLPCQLTFWKERGEWKTYHPLTEQVIQQFGSNIDNHLLLMQAEGARRQATA